MDFIWCNNVVCFGPCASILPGSMLQFLKMKQKACGEKGWVSDDAKGYSRNLRGPETALKQTSWTGTKVNWFMVLAKGKAHVEVTPADWSLDGLGLAMFVQRLPGILRRLLGVHARLPKTVFTDRGTGMYSPHGSIVSFYEDALEQAGFKPFWGSDAGQQSPDMPDVLLHETAVAMFRRKMRTQKPVVAPWKETLEQWAERAGKVVAWMNSECNLDSLCRKFPERLDRLQRNGGDRLVEN